LDLSSARGLHLETLHQILGIYQDDENICQCNEQLKMLALENPRAAEFAVTLLDYRLGARP